MFKKHTPCPGKIDCKCCPYNATVKSDSGITCNIHKNNLNTFQSPIIKPSIKLIRKYNSNCARCYTNMFYIPKYFGKCSLHGYCKECSLDNFHDCPICMSMDEID
jgi:hypothetical protein